MPVHKQRLTSPRSKFEVTNMADNQVDLTPEDIPGASFIEEEIGKLTVCSTKVLVKMPPHKLREREGKELWERAASRPENLIPLALKTAFLM